jgi:hypothetical protein
MGTFAYSLKVIVETTIAALDIVTKTLFIIAAIHVTVEVVKPIVRFGPDTVVLTSARSTTVGATCRGLDLILFVSG